MGSGSYSSSARELRAFSMGYDSKPAEEIFTQEAINNGMNPQGINVRESRDSEEHPNSLAIILALDVTGSMGTVPHYLVKNGLPEIMSNIIDGGIKDPQVLFMGIGDHECDSSPLQVGQFESNDELLDKWLTDLFLEGRGGGNYGESYMLAWYFAEKHTSIDCLEKRNEKGFLFTIGDEPVLKSIPKSSLKEIMGEGQYDESMDSLVLLERAREKYHVFHINIRQTASGSRQDVIDGWKQLMGDNLIIAERREDVARLIADTIKKYSSKKSAKKSNSKPHKEDILL